MRLRLSAVALLFLTAASASQPAPRNVVAATRLGAADSFWVILSYTLGGGPDSVITSVRTGTQTIAEHRLPASRLRDSFNLPSPPAGSTYTGAACAQSKRRGLLSPTTCVSFTFTNSDVPPPPPVIDSVRTDTAVVSSLLFLDTFANGVRAPAQNGVFWTAASAGNGDSVRVVPGALRFVFKGDSLLSSDAWAEQNGKLPKLSEVFFCLWYKVPANYIHRNDPNGPDNNKGIRIFGGMYDGAPRDSAYRNSSVKAGYSTLPRSAPTAAGETSQIIVEYGMGLDAVGAGNYSTGPWRPWFRPGALERIGFYAKAGTMTRPSVASDSTTNTLAGDAIIRVWKDGVLQYSRANLAMFTPGAPNVFTDFYLLGWSNSGFTQTTAIELQRIEVSVTPTAACTTP